MTIKTFLVSRSKPISLLRSFLPKRDGGRSCWRTARPAAGILHSSYRTWYKSRLRADVVQVAQMEIVFQPLYRLTIGVVRPNAIWHRHIYSYLLVLMNNQVMIVLGSCLCAYGAIYSPNLSCNVIRPTVVPLLPQCLIENNMVMVIWPLQEMPDYDIGVGGLLIACGCSHLVGMCLSNGSK